MPDKVSVLIIENDPELNVIIVKPITMCNFPNCTRPTPAGKEYCFMHNAKFGTVKIKNSDNSADRVEREKEYSKKKKAYVKAHPACEVKDCENETNDLHHMCGRVGDLLTDENYFLAVCRKHHDIIEKNPAWAKQNGYSISRLKKPVTK